MASAARCGGAICQRPVTQHAAVAHGLVVGSQPAELVVIGNQAQPAIQTAVVMSVTGVEEHALVPDDILQRRPVGGIFSNAPAPSAVAILPTVSGVALSLPG